ncbi:MAG: DUF4445 domain-containing protein [Oscillospiraceae bacterium]|nr:DUF4445 domain-containing protein [Oscillospiraceae bacterium]
MPVLKLWQNDICREISFSGMPTLVSLLLQHGITAAHPCGGSGICGKCAIRAEGALSAPTAAEEKAGTRLSCQIMLLGDAEVWLREDAGVIETSGSAPVLGTAMDGLFGAAVDIGTTTIALKLYDLKTGTLLAQEGAMNPQYSIAADVMGRIGAAMGGLLPMLQDMVTEVIQAMLTKACARKDMPVEQVGALVVTGNTTMLYLLTGRDPACLSCAPFQADCLFDRMDTLLGIPVYYPPCMNAFVGADITCAVLDSGMHLRQETALLCDIGTNGELALWNEGKLYVTSTAAGPAFEGAGISCGCGSIPGAIDRVWTENGKVQIHTIGNQKAVGICGSGLVDAIAVFLETGDIDETGAVDADALPLAEQVALLPADVRAVQLAKGAIAAGIRTLLELAEVAEEKIDTLYIAGGFGSHLNVASAAAIGLIPRALEGRVTILGNGALSGAAQLLLCREAVSRARELAQHATHVTLSGNSHFNQHFWEAMFFGDEDIFE